METQKVLNSEEFKQLVQMEYQSINNDSANIESIERQVVAGVEVLLNAGVEIEGALVVYDWQEDSYSEDGMVSLGSQDIHAKISELCSQFIEASNSKELELPQGYYLAKVERILAKRASKEIVYLVRDVNTNSSARVVRKVSEPLTLNDEYFFKPLGNRSGLADNATYFEQVERIEVQDALKKQKEQQGRDVNKKPQNKGSNQVDSSLVFSGGIVQDSEEKLARLNSNKFYDQAVYA